MRDLIIHPLTLNRLDAYNKQPPQVVLLVGPSGTGKLSLVKMMAEEALALKPGTIDTHQYSLVVKPQDDAKTIGIETARSIERFLNLKVPAKRDIHRSVIIENAQLMSLEAQNALLKTFEEPPSGTIILLTATHGQSLLPTIRSRVQTINVQRPARQDLFTHFENLNFSDEEIGRAYVMSGGLPGLMHALLDDKEHPLKVAAQQARQLVSQPLFDRLAAIESLSKQRQLAIDTVEMLQQMAHIGLQTATGKTARRWQRVLRASYDAAEALGASAQMKLVLTDMVVRF